MLRTLLTGAGVAAALALTACESSSSTTRPATQPEMGMLNSTCPMSGEAVDPGAKSAEYHGYKIGFCCDMCAGHWEKKTDEEKQAAVAKYMK